MALDMESLAARSESAKNKFAALRDGAGKTILEEKVAPSDLEDLLVLNKILGDRNSTLTWFDRVKGSAHWKPVLERLAYYLEVLLIQERRWADLGKIYGDPASVLERANDAWQRPVDYLSQGFDDEMRKVLEEVSRRRFREKAGKIYAGLLAAGREEESRKIAARARELDDSTEMVSALVSTALAASQPRKDQIEWLTAAMQKDRSLKNLLDRTNDALSRLEKK